MDISHTISDADTTTAAVPAREDRSLPLRDLVDLSIETIFGLKPTNEQQLNQLLGVLVRSKALSADESYTLRDQLQNLHHFETALDSRIEALLSQRGLITPEIIAEIHAIEEGTHQKTI